MSNERQPLVGVVIPVYNDWVGLQYCLNALACQTYPSSLLRVRVVDNGSSDWPQQPSFPLPVEVIRYPRPGSYGARNQAALGWGVDVLAFTDADCEPDGEWIAAGVKALQLGAVPPIVVAGRIQLVARQPDRPSLGEQLDQILGFDQERTVRRAGFGVTANLFVPCVLFEQLGGFKSGTRSGGDRDFCRRAVVAGATMLFSHHALISHPARVLRDLVLKQRRIVGGRLVLATRATDSQLAVLLLSLRPIVSESLRVCRYTHIDLLRRMQLLGLVWWIRAHVLLEWVRLQGPHQIPLR